MDPIASLPKPPKFPKPFNAVGAAADSNKFDELPESVVHHILSFLKTIEVMRASAVSTSWKYLCTSMPHLDLDYRICPSNKYDKFRDFVNWVLMTHDESASIQSCRLACVKDEDDKSVYRWIDKLAKKHVKKLYLSVESGNEDPFVLPYCLVASDSLEVLEIDLLDCALEIPSCAGFSRLKSLKLASIWLLDENLFQNFISSCPLLEKLTLEECDFPGYKVFHISSRNLRKLVIESDGFSTRKCQFKITCPNLVSFKLWGSLERLFWGGNSSFMQKAFLDLCLPYGEVPNGSTNFVLEFLKSVCHVEILALSMNISKYFPLAVAKPECFSTIFSNLKSLRLSTEIEACYMQSIIYLLKCAPNLQHLSIYINHKKEFERDYKYKKVDENTECLPSHVKTIKLINLNGSDAELELIRFFMKNAHVLEKMCIIWNSWLDQEAQWESNQKVMKFLSSSSHVNVTFLKNSERKLVGVL